MSSSECITSGFQTVKEIPAAMQKCVKVSIVSILPVRS